MLTTVAPEKHDHSHHHTRLSAVYFARLPRDVRHRRDSGCLRPLRQPAWTWPTTGTGCACPRRWPPSSRNGRVATIRTASAACGGSTTCCRSRRCEQCVTIGEGQTLLHASEGVAQLRRRHARPLVPAVRGDESLGQLQGQRHVGRLQPRPARRRHARRLRLDRQHQRLAGPLLLRHAADEGGDLHRLGQDFLRQALAGARLRRADRADHRRFRRRHGPRPGSQQATGHLPGQQRQSLPPGRAEDDHVPRAGSAAAGKCPTGSSCPAETWATPAPSARHFTSCTSWA